LKKEKILGLIRIVLNVYRQDVFLYQNIFRWADFYVFRKRQAKQSMVKSKNRGRRGALGAARMHRHPNRRSNANVHTRGVRTSFSGSAAVAAGLGSPPTPRGRGCEACGSLGGPLVRSLLYEASKAVIWAGGGGLGGASG
jgi:hypothetical protein